MKKFCFKSLCVILTLLLLTVQSHILSAKQLDFGVPGIDQAVFDFDANSFEQAMASLNDLDNYLNDHQGVTYSVLIETSSELIADLTDLAAPPGVAQSGEDPLGIPSFWWGCVLGWIGILLVYIFSGNDQGQAKKALSGCLINAGIVVAVYTVALMGGPNF